MRCAGIVVADCWRESEFDAARLRRPVLSAAACVLALGVALAALRDPGEAEDRDLVTAEAQEGATTGDVLRDAVREALRADLVNAAEQRLRMLEQRLDASDQERDRLQDEFRRLQTELASRDRQAAEQSATQLSALDRINEQTSASVEAISRLIARAGIDPERLVSAVRREGGVGGPFIRLSENHLVATDVVSQELGGPIARLAALRRALAALPIEAPLAGSYVITSAFGARRDPFYGSEAMHYGLDFAASLRTPVLATAPGVVTFAGWGGDYGNMVEIDHGLGIRTRYGHLFRVDVRPGETVGARVRVGLLGSTGRSTGPHLHYEVIFEDENLDPMRFIEAKRLVVRSLPRERRAARG